MRKRTAAHSRKMPLGNPPATGKEDQFAQVYMGGNTNQGALSWGPDQMLWKELPKRGKKKAGVEKSCPLSRALAKDVKGFAFIVIADGFILFLGIISVYLV